jgi:hypothetical protein
LIPQRLVLVDQNGWCQHRWIDFFSLSAVVSIGASIIRSSSASG